jgi:glycosyl transferase family 25
MSGWEQLDAVLYINLEHRTDRQKHLLAQLASVGVPFSKIHRVNAVLKNPGALGCTLSHIKAFQMILAEGWERVLVLEDDFTWMPDMASDAAEKIGELMTCRKPWDVVQISWNPSGRVVGDGPLNWLRRAVGVRTTSGYFIRLGFVEELLKNFKEAAVDMYKNGFSPESCCDMNWQKLQHDTEWYVAYPPLGYQMDGYSDVEGREVSYGC